MQLPSPSVRFAPDFEARLGQLVARVASRRERHEGAGRAALVGAGTEFVGYRPYRAGEDLRRLDWNLYARLRKPFVRVARREASEHWAVLVDSSASMGVGVPGKLQTAAEVAAGVAAIGRKLGAEVQLVTSAAREGLRFGARDALTGFLRALEGTRAAGTEGLAALAREPARFRDAGAVFLIGDFLDLEPSAVLALTRRGRDLFCVQLLAPEERTPAADAGSVCWVDAEDGAEHELELDAATVGAYEALLARRLEAWGQACARHRVRFETWGSDSSFEDVVHALFL